MADNLPKAGVELVAENSAGFQKALEQANKSLDGFQSTAKSMAKGMDASNKSILDIAGSIKSLINPVTVAAAAAAALGKAFIDLGGRGAKVRDIAESFRLLAGDAGILANVLLKDLREAARGTVSDFELMQRANLALAGTTGAFRTEFLEALPRLLEVARVQARATGQDVNYLYESLVTGIKRTSPLLIDNTGIVLKIGEANAKYAAELGKTVEQMTTEEKQTALLNATLEAGAVAVEKLGTANLTTSEKMAAIPVAIQNAMDRVAVAIQPLWDLVVGVLLDIATGIGDFIQNQLAPALNNVANFIAQIIQVIGPGVIAIWNFVKPIFQAIITVVGTVVQFLANQVGAFFKGGYYMVGALAGGMQRAYTELIQPIVIGIAEFIASFLAGQSPPPEGPLSDIDTGGRNVLQAWLDGFVGASLDPVEEVAAQVADMMGEVANYSLAQVQQRIAQLDAQLKPFSDRVDILKARFDALNEPAQLAFEAIDRQMQKAQEALAAGDMQAAATLRQLDAQRESLQNVVDAEQSQLDNAQIQLALARAQQEEERTLLNIRKAMLPVTEAQSKATAKASKARKAGTAKAKKATGTMPTLPDTGIEGGVTPLTPEAIAAQDLEGLIPPEEVPFDIGADIANSVAEGWLQGIGGIEGAAKFTEGQNRLQAAIGKINGSSIVQKFQDTFSNLPQILQDSLITPIQDAIDDVVNFFTGTDPGTLGWAVSSIGTNFGIWVGDASVWLQDNIGTPIQGFITDAGNWLLGTGEGTFGGVVSGIGANINVWIGDASLWFKTNITDYVTKFISDVQRLLSGDGEGSLGAIFSTIGANIGLWVSDAKNWFEDNIGRYIWGEDGFLTRFSNWLTNPATEGGMANILTNLGPNIVGWLQSAADAIAANPVVQSLMSGFQSVVNFLFGTEMSAEGQHTLYTAIQALGTELPMWLSNAIATLDEDFVQPLIGEDGLLRPAIDYFFDTETEGTLAYALNRLFSGGDAEEGSIPYFVKQATDFLLGVPQMIINALKQLGLALWRAIAVPFINIINFVIDKVNGFVKTITEAIFGAYNAIAGLAGQPSVNPGAIIPEIPKISTEPPGWLTGAAKGGLFSSGLMKVGERGEEMIASASKLAVFPNRMVSAMENLAQVIAQPVPMPVTAGYGGGDSIDNSRSLTINGGMGGDATDERRLLAHLMAFFEGY